MGGFFVKNKQHILFLGLVIGSFIFMRYLMPLVLPLVLAFLFVASLAPLLDKVHQKLHIGKGTMAGVILLVIFSILGVIIWLLCAWLFHKISILIQNMELYEAEFLKFIAQTCQKVENSLGVNAKELEIIILEKISFCLEDIQNKILPGILNQSTLCITFFAKAITFTVVTIIAAVLLAKDFENIKDKCREFAVYRHAKGLWEKIGKLMVSFLKAQGIIILVISIVCVIGMYFAGIKNFVFLGIITGILDALPFIGTGLILLPMTVWHLFQKQFASAIFLGVSYIMCLLTRELLEPRLLGQELGVFPVSILISVYAGVKVFGILGIFLGPLYLLVLCECYKKVYEKKEA